MYNGKKLALPPLLTGLERLEYRGYDSAGLVLLEDGLPAFYKAPGQLQNLREKVKNSYVCSSFGMAHTRWATHGGATEANAHPHVSQSQDLIIVHNGIVENYLVIKKKLENSGFTFYSETDTEVLVNFIELIKIDKKLDLTSAVQVALSEIVGACAMMVYSQSEKLLVAVNRGGQLFAGVNGSECFVASDKNAFAGYSKNFFEIGNNQFLLVRSGKEPKLLNFNLEVLKPEIEELDVDINQLTKGDYPNFMLKEIHEQPEIMRQGMTGRINFKTQEICFGGLDECWEQIKQASSLVIVACGTSFHAGLLAKYWLEKLVNIPVKVEYASEFQAATIKAGDIVLGISQSGTTADTIVALEAAKDQGAITLGVCNVVNSKMARLVNAGIYTRAGVENGVASTKAFTAQALALLLFALKLANDKKTISNFNLRIINQLESLPNLMEQALGSEKVIRTLARKLKQTTNCLFLGRGYSFPVALEGALKLKEISYVHAEGLPAGESKHGPLALIDEAMPVIVIATQGEFYYKTMNNISEIKHHGGRVIALVNKNDNEITGLTKEIIVVPLVDDILSPLINVIPLQLFAYYSAFSRGKDVDHPRNLAKSVTTE